MAPKQMNDVDTIRFLLLCIEKCDTKAINYEEIASESGLDGKKAAYKRLWDLKNKIRSRDAAEGRPKPQPKVKKTKSPKTSPRKQRAPLRKVQDQTREEDTREEVDIQEQEWFD